MDEPIIGGPAALDGDPEPGDAEAVIARLKQALAATVPGLDPGLIQGESLEDVEASFEALKSLANATPPPAAVPAGAPGRLQVQPGTPFEKIREGLARLAG